MSTDITEIHGFYHSPLGRLAQKHIGYKIASLWPDAVDETVAGYGYPLPYLESYYSRAKQVVVFMPCFQGASPWPENKPNVVSLTPPECLPVHDQSLTRLLMIHGLEHSENPSCLLREAWRVLVEGGRLILVVPNRRGLWARNPAIPFGSGRPYSGRQLYTLIEESLFTPYKVMYALFTPPVPSTVLLRSSETLETLGGHWMNKWGGVTLIEACKQVISPVLERPKAWRPRIFIPQPAPKNF